MGICIFMRIHISCFFKCVYACVFVGGGMGVGSTNGNFVSLVNNAMLVVVLFVEVRENLRVQSHRACKCIYSLIRLNLINYRKSLAWHTKAAPPRNNITRWPWADALAGAWK